MTQTVTVTLALRDEQLNVFSRIGSSAGPEYCFALAAQQLFEGDAGHAAVLEILALLHFPVIDHLVFELPAEHVEAQRKRLQLHYAGRHVVRNTECRSQMLTVTIRRVLV